MTSETTVAVVVLNFNGKHFLETFLPAIVSHSSPHRVFLADNGSTDDSTAFVEQNYPMVTVIRNGGNYGYAQGYNLALARIEADYFILLNSDVEVTPGWIGPVVSLMEEDKSIGACQPKILDHAQRSRFEYAGAGGGFIDAYGYPFCRGRIFNSLEEDHGQYNHASEVFWATGACLFLRSQAFRQAGGLDNAYFAHMEEIDLCWRLKNFGHKVFVQPASVIYHVGGGTLNKLSRRKTYLNFRNNLTTLTKNHPPGYLFLKILYRLVLDGVAGIKFLCDGQPKHFLAVIHAHFSYYARLPAILAERKRLQRQPGFRHSYTNVYKGNIVIDYFLRGRKKFTSLPGKFTS